MSKFSEDNKKDDEAWDPGPSLVCMDDLVTEESDQKSACCDDNDPSPTWHITVDSIEQLCPNDDVHGRPANAC